MRRVCLVAALVAVSCTVSSGQTTTAAPATTTAAPATTTAAPATTTMQATTAAPKKKEFVLSFLTTEDRQAFVKNLAKAYRIDTSQIRVVRESGTTLVFEFVGAKAESLTAEFATETLASLQTSFGVSKREERDAEPIDDKPADKKSDGKTVAIVVSCVVVALAIAIGGAFFFHRKRQQSEAASEGRYGAFENPPTDHDDVPKDVQYV